MKANDDNQGAEAGVSEQTYARLLHLYPEAFRKEYGLAMAQLFKDQCNAARASGGWSRLGWLWVQTFADLICSVGREHVHELSKNMNRPLDAIVWRSRLTFMKVFMAMLLLLTPAIIFASYKLLPKVYSSTARMHFDDTRAGRAGAETYHLPTEFEKLTSRTVLMQVIEELDLTTWFMTQTGSKVRPTAEEAYEMLRQAIEINPIRNSRLLDIRVKSDNAMMAAKIANEISRAYIVLSLTQRERAPGRIVDQAQPPLRPMRPNIPFDMAIALLMSLGVAGAVSWRARNFFRLPAGA